MKAPSNRRPRWSRMFEDLLHSFADHKHVIDVRNFGLMGAIEMAPRDGAPGCARRRGAQEVLLG